MMYGTCLFLWKIINCPNETRDLRLRGKFHKSTRLLDPVTENNSTRPFLFCHFEIEIFENVICNLSKWNLLLAAYTVRVFDILVQSYVFTLQVYLYIWKCHSCIFTMALSTKVLWTSTSVPVLFVANWQLRNFYLIKDCTVDYTAMHFTLG